MLKKNNHILKKKLDYLFTNLKIKKGDNLIIHSNIAGLFQFKKNKKENISKSFFNYLIKKLGKKSTLLIPVYSYSFTNKKIFCPNSTISDLGVFGNYLLKKYAKNRTLNPVFSHLVFGKLKREIFRADTKSAFGLGTIFDLLHIYNFKILNFCCSPNTITFIHHVEQLLGVKYRFLKIFTGTIKHKNKSRKITYKYCVGKKNINYLLKNKQILKLLDKRKFKEQLFGRYYCYITSAKYLMSKIKKNISRNKFFLIK